MLFCKAHGLGNDFIIIDDRPASIKNESALAKTLCCRRTGIGADGLILVRSSASCDIFMRIFNSDGSEAEMCGNGVRCFAKYVFDRQIITATSFTVETLAGPMVISLQEENGRAKTVKVNMGRPELAPEKIPVAYDGSDFLLKEIEVLGQRFTLSAILLGVPHATVFVEDIKKIDIEKYGRAIETHPLFPKRINVNFSQVLDAHNIVVRTWERGAGATLACGTGASSVAVCCALAGKTAKQANIILQLGALHIDWNDDGNVYMTGPAEIVFEGELK